MFTGIITHLGKVKSRQKSVFVFNASPAFCKKIKNGTSIAINGVCLTVFKKPTVNSFAIEAMPETLNQTTLGNLRSKDLVNLELPPTPYEFLSGHIVTGHIDGVCKLTNITEFENSRILKLSISDSLSKFVVKKGSIAVNGISLTVIKAEKDFFTVGVIPYTWTHTMLNTLKLDDNLNIEVDILAKYTEKFLSLSK